MSESLEKIVAKMKLIKEYVNPLELARNLEGPHPIIADVRNQVSFICEHALGNNMANTSDELELRAFLSRKIIQRLLNPHVEKSVLLEVAKDLRRLSVYFETGIIPEHLPSDEDAGL